MKAVTFQQHGDVDQLHVDRVPIPEIGRGEVLVRVKACALNHLDLWIRQGIPAYRISLPHISGCDIAGVIEQVEDDAEHSSYDLAVGQAVVISPGLSCWSCPCCLAGKDNLCPSFKILGAHVDGGYAEFVSVPRINVLPIPPVLTFEQAAAFPLVSVTAWHMVRTLANLQPTETVLVMGAGSGVGSMAIQLANMIGARVLSTVGTEEKMAKAKELGVDEVINHHSEDVGQKARDLTDGRGVDVVIEHIGQRVWKGCFNALARGGRLVTCGATTGGEITIDARSLFSRQLTVMGSYMGTRTELLRACTMIERGTIHPVVDRVFPLEEAHAAQNYLLSRKAFGKVVLAVN